MNKANKRIQQLGLEKHPEGGYYKETYRSEGFIINHNLPIAFKGNRNYSTSIYFLLTSEEFSAFHKINQDEIWHFYEGSPIKIHQIAPDGTYSFIVLGSEHNASIQYQHVVPAQHWFAATVMHPESYSLVGCTVSPGFDFNDFTLAKREELTKAFPQHKKIIQQLTRI